MTKYSRKNLFGSKKSPEPLKTIDPKKKKPFFDKSIFEGRVSFSELSLKLKIKRIFSIILIILFLPFAIITLIKGDFVLFFGGSLVVYVLIKIGNILLDR